MTRIGIDTNVMMGLLDPNDIWNRPANDLSDILLDKKFEIAIFDCVLAETISTLSRRIHEKRRSAELDNLLMKIAEKYPPKDVIWVFPEVPQRYNRIVELVRESGGELNFNDALIALVCRDYGIPMLASFDRDFDSVNWLKRIAHPSDLA
jgi:predicted nucleic acid-binding protein